MKSFVISLLLIASTLICSAQNSAKSSRTAQHSRAFLSAQEKLDFLARNGSSSHPANTPTVLSAGELSAFVNEGGVTLPKGVSNVKFSSTPGVITTTTKVDFDQITAGKSSMNPLMMLFTGVHDVAVVANATGSNAMGHVDVQKVEIDGVSVPRPALEYFVNHYLKPKYGDNVGMQSTFKLPARIDSAQVGQNSVTLRQR